MKPRILIPIRLVSGLCLLFVWWMIIAPSEAQEDSILVYDMGYPVYSHIWSVNVETGEKQFLAEIVASETGISITGLYIDAEHKIAYYVENPHGVPYNYPGYLIRYNWVNQTKQVVYRRINLAGVQPYADDAHLLVDFFPEGTKRPYPTVGPDTCLMSVETWQCVDYTGEISKRLGYIPPLLWLDGDNALQALDGSIDWLDIQGGVVNDTVDIPHQYVDRHLQRLASNEVLFLAHDDIAYGVPPNLEATNHVYTLNTDTVEVSPLFSFDGMGKPDDVQLSPDKTMLLVVGEETVCVYNIDTGTSILEFQRTAHDAVVGNITFNDVFRWSGDNSRLFAEATLNGADEDYFLLSIDIATGQITPITSIGSPFDFVQNGP